ncbi:type IV secretory system conjugative DNA transfer family protein, partial [Rhizobium ruizarguesonis]
MLSGRRWKLTLSDLRVPPPFVSQPMRKDEQIIIVQGHSPIRCGRAIYFRRKYMDAQAKANRFVRT